jgi:hypothetical protein
MCSGKTSKVAFLIRSFQFILLFQRRKAAPAALTGRSFFILEEQVKLKKQSPGLGEEYLKRLVNQAYEKLPKEQKVCRKKM